MTTAFLSPDRSRQPIESSRRVARPVTPKRINLWHGWFSGTTTFARLRIAPVAAVIRKTHTTTMPAVTINLLLAAAFSAILSTQVLIIWQRSVTSSVCGVMPHFPKPFEIRQALSVALPNRSTPSRSIPTSPFTARRICRHC